MAMLVAALREGGMAGKLERVCVFGPGPDSPELPIVEGEGSARAIVWPGVGARFRSMHRISLGAGARTAELRHPMEAVYYIIAGGGSVRDGAAADATALIEGSMIFVEPGTRYAIEAGAEGIEVLGGPCPPDPALYAGL